MGTTRMNARRSAFQFKGETEEISEHLRQTVPGNFIRLPLGYTHYELSGSKHGNVVVLVHGFSIPYKIWDPTFEHLADAGFSDRPDLDYDLDLFVKQLVSLLEELDIDKPVDVVGLSMGGPISLSLCDKFPHLVRKLCLIDPAGLAMTSSLLTRLILRPWIGEMLFSLFGNRILLSELTKDFNEPGKFPAYVEMAQAQLRYKGYKRALLSTLRNDALSDLYSLYERVGKQERNSLLIWGIEDRLIPFKLSQLVLKVFPEIQFHAIEGAGHIPHFEKPEVVNPLLIEFLEDETES
jgi:pimeloyl-ACP methyl ester carboxylesterase